MVPQYGIAADWTHGRLKIHKNVFADSYYGSGRVIHLFNFLQRLFTFVKSFEWLSGSRNPFPRIRPHNFEEFVDQSRVSIHVDTNGLLLLGTEIEFDGRRYDALFQNRPISSISEREKSMVSAATALVKSFDASLNTSKKEANNNNSNIMRSEMLFSTLLQ